MLSVNINRDVEQYQESVLFGLNAKQVIFVLLAVAAGAGTVCLLYFGMGLPMEISIYVSLPVCVPIVLPALGKQYGLSITERIWQSNKQKKVLAFSSVPVKEEKTKEGSQIKKSVAGRRGKDIRHGKGRRDKKEGTV